MGDGNHQLNVAGTLTAHLLLGNLNTATVADNTLVTDALILAAGTLIVLCGTKDALTEQTVTLRLVGTIVDGLRLGNLTERTLENLLGRSQSYRYLGKVALYFCIFLESHIIILNYEFLIIN